MSLIFDTSKTRSEASFGRKTAASIVLGLVLLVGIYAWFSAGAFGTMLILRGVAGDNAPRGLLDDNAALAYARKHGYAGEVIDVAADGGPQVQLALKRIREGGVTALYGFSGGGFNATAVWNALKPEERARIRRIVVVGAPGITKASFPGAREVVVQEDPPAGHMEGPRALLQSGN
ncbi:MAG: hypothetical protein KF794_11280 [Xanthobacteraceae bacterium]|nr:hypothetical protein [Xanthobacteraceae bacterium]QYK44354.1 MAG: hypothetical protein KF794_11280 [Xanthobacteraceae bacterium]